MTFLAGEPPPDDHTRVQQQIPIVLEPTQVLPADEPKLVVVPPHNRVVSDQWIRNRIISAVAVTCFAANIITWMTTREVNAVLIGAGLSLLMGVPLLNRGDKRE